MRCPESARAQIQENAKLGPPPPWTNPRALNDRALQCLPMSNAYNRLLDFLGQKMRMSHVYQPVMLEVLLAHGGTASVHDIAASILTHDESQIDYYEEIVKRMPGRWALAVNRGNPRDYRSRR